MLTIFAFKAIGDHITVKMGRKLIAFLGKLDRKIPPQPVDRGIAMIGLGCLKVVLQRLIVDGNQSITDCRSLILPDIDRNPQPSRRQTQNTDQAWRNLLQNESAPVRFLRDQGGWMRMQPPPH